MLTSWYTEYNGKVCIMEKVLKMEVSTELHYVIIKRVFKSAKLTQEDQAIVNHIVF